MDLSFAVNQTPACGNSVTFALNPTKTFLSLVSLTTSGGIVRISGATVADTGTYSETLKVTDPVTGVTNSS